MPHYWLIAEGRILKDLRLFGLFEAKEAAGFVPSDSSLFFLQVDALLQLSAAPA